MTPESDLQVQVRNAHGLLQAMLRKELYEECHHEYLVSVASQLSYDLTQAVSELYSANAQSESRVELKEGKA